tara:strand:- start:244 stop:519 length:276 start_codon:yes stop_codon:yes gene_type:complete
MFRRKPKIKETKRLPFRGRQQSYNTSAWDSMSFIEQIAMILLPCMLGFIFYMILDITGLELWWIKSIIAIGMVAGCIGLITLIVNFFSETY